MSWKYGATLLVRTSSESVELDEKWVYYFHEHSFTSVTNDIQLVQPYLFH